MIDFDATTTKSVNGITVTPVCLFSLLKCVVSCLEPFFNATTDIYLNSYHVALNPVEMLP
jgi:hypothetical protein